MFILITQIKGKLFFCNILLFVNNHIIILYGSLFFVSYDLQHGNAIWLKDHIIFKNQLSEDSRIIEVENGPGVYIINCSFQSNYIM